MCTGASFSRARAPLQGGVEGGRRRDQAGLSWSGGVGAFLPLDRSEAVPRGPLHPASTAECNVTMKGWLHPAPGSN